jgi:TonB-dependent SusC/RagA subfamily outer membrane receptor
MNMRKLTNIFLLLCLTNFVFGQDASAGKTDSTKQAQSFVIRDPAVLTDDETLIILDDKRTTKSSSKHILEKIKPNDIIELSVLKGASAEALYGSKGANGVIIITTKQYAISRYQQKFSTFSKKYKRYIDSLKSNDDEIVYVKDAVPITGKNENDVISQVYKISKESITDIKFIDNPYLESGNKKYMVLIIE